MARIEKKILQRPIYLGIYTGYSHGLSVNADQKPSKAPEWKCSWEWTWLLCCSCRQPTNRIFNKHYILQVTRWSHGAGLTPPPNHVHVLKPNQDHESCRQTEWSTCTEDAVLVVISYASQQSASEIFSEDNMIHMLVNRDVTAGRQIFPNRRGFAFFFFFFQFLRRFFFWHVMFIISLYYAMFDRVIFNSFYSAVSLSVISPHTLSLSL